MLTTLPPPPLIPDRWGQQLGAVVREATGGQEVGDAVPAKCHICDISQMSSARWHEEERKSVRDLLLGTGDVNTEVLGDHSEGVNFLSIDKQEFLPAWKGSPNIRKVAIALG